MGSTSIQISFGKNIFDDLLNRNKFIIFMDCIFQKKKKNKKRKILVTVTALGLFYIQGSFIPLSSTSQKHTNKEV